MPCTRSRSPSKSGMRVCEVSRRRPLISSQPDAMSMPSISLRGTITSSTRRRSRPSRASTMPWRSTGSATSASARSSAASPSSRGRAAWSRRGSARKQGATSQATGRAATRRSVPSRRSQPSAPRSSKQRKAGGDHEREIELRRGRRERDAGDERGDQERAQQHGRETGASRLVGHASRQAQDPGLRERCRRRSGARARPASPLRSGRRARAVRGPRPGTRG